MPIPAELMAERAASWAESDAAVRAMIVYGSLAQGSADEGSDLDVIIVAEPGQRDALWDRREQISDLIHGGHHAIWHQEPLWQRPYRYQSWDEKLAGLDPTLDEEHAGPRPPRLSPRSCAVPCGQQRSCTHGLSTDGRSAPGSQCRETR